MFFPIERALTSSAIGTRLAQRRKARGPIALAIYCVMVLPMAAEIPLSMDQARALAVERSRQLVAQDLAISAAREMAVAAGQLPDPVLSVGIDNVPVSGPDRWRTGGDFMTMRRVAIAQEWTHSDKRQSRADRLEREAQRVLAEKSVSQAAIERETAIAWLDRYYTEAMTTIITDQLAEARLAVDAAEAAYRGNKGSQADVFAARADVVSIEDRASELGRQGRNATTILGRWIGNAATAPLGAKPTMESVALDPQHLAEQLSRHPELTVLANQEGIAQAEVRLAQANKRPDWSVEVGYQRRGSGYPDMVSFGVSVPLQWDRQQRQNREVAAKLLQAEQAKAEREEALRQHIAQARTLLEEWSNNRERLARFANELVPLAQQRSAATLTAYRGAKARLDEVLAARRAELAVRLQALELEANTARLWAQLNFLAPQRKVQQQAEQFGSVNNAR